MRRLYTPALPDIAKFLDISNSDVQKSLSIFLVGYAFGNLIWGPLANRHGRKGATFIGIVLAIFGSLITLAIKLYPHAWLLNTGRLITALGASVGIKIAFTYISDLYPKEESASKIAYLMLSFAIAPGLAIATGGFLTKYVSWYSCLYAILFYSVIMLLLSCKLPETLHKDHAVPLNLHNITEGYLTKLRNKTLIKSSLLMGCGTSFIYLFASLGPFTGMNEAGMSPETYGLYNFIPPIGMILGFYLTQVLQNKIKSMDQIKLGITLSAMFTSILMFAFLKGMINPLTLFLPIPGLYVGLSLVFSNASSISIASATNKSNASAMTNFLNMGLCVLVLFGTEALPFPPSKVLS
jgi:MFS transporter, DHA1 family, multidrug resistance protein